MTNTNADLVSGCTFRSPKNTLGGFVSRIQTNQGPGIFLVAMREMLQRDNRTRELLAK